MYNLAAQTNAGAILFAVCRGKISEGLDFGDATARAVLIVGVPFPNLKDMKVSLKMEYNTQKKKSNASILSGDEWYNLQAFRAVNQGECYSKY
jgi:Rad3-related DNA helicase